MQFRPSSRSTVTINIAPLVDVVFLLVIFFAVSTTFLETAGIQLTLPSSSSTAERTPRELTVWVTADGTLTLDGDTLSLEELETRLRERLAEMDSKRVVLRADRETSHGTVVHVMDAARAAGADALTVAARSPE